MSSAKTQARTQALSGKKSTGEKSTGAKATERKPSGEKPSAKKSAGGIAPAKPVVLASLIDFQEGTVVSRSLVQAPQGTMTVFAFDAGEGLSEHTSPYDAYVQILDGKAVLNIGGQAVPAKAGETVLMPAGVPHGLEAKQPMKMLLTLIRAQPQ